MSQACFLCSLTDWRLNKGLHFYIHGRELRHLNSAPNQLRSVSLKGPIGSVSRPPNTPLVSAQARCPVNRTVLTLHAVIHPMRNCLQTATAPLMAAVLATAVLLTAAVAQADEAPQAAPEAPAKKAPSSEQLAIEAAQVQGEHCANAASRLDTSGARSISIVSDTWVRVSERYDQSGESYLLYWRGVLAQCMDKEDFALQDLENFISRSEGNALWATLIKDATRRTRQLSRKTGRTTTTRSQAPAPSSAVLGVVLGASLAGASAGCGIAGASWWSRSQEKADLIRALPQEQRQELIALEEYVDGNQAWRTSSVLTVAAIGLGAGAMVSFLVTARNGASATASVPPPVLIPTSTGAVLSWGMPF